MITKFAALFAIVSLISLPSAVLACGGSCPSKDKDKSADTSAISISVDLDGNVCGGGSCGDKDKNKDSA